MKCVVLQPSFIPWRGHFEQMYRTDLFVFLDDVQYDHLGWRNRNRIKTPNGIKWITVPVLHKGHLTVSRRICDIRIVPGERWGRKLCRMLEQSYAKAPYFNNYAPILERWLRDPPSLLVDLTVGLSIAIAGELGIPETRFIRASSLGVHSDEPTDRLIGILQKVGAEQYISGPAAKSYIAEEKFHRAGIDLEYMSYDYPEYPQLHPPYEPGVSIVDLLFMAGPDAPRHIWGN